MRRLVMVLCGLASSVALAADPWHALFISDVHLLSQLSSQTDYYHSDTGLSDLWPSAKQEIHQLITKTQPKFVLLLGDLPAHDMTLKEMADSDKQVFGDVSNLSQGRPWFYVTGNNDSLAGDYHSFSHLEGSGKVTNVLSLVHSPIPGAGFSAQCGDAHEACVINAGAYNDVPYYFGYYSAYPTRDHRLRLIVLNTIMWLPSRYVSDDGVSQQYAGDLQMQWLGEQLSEAAQQSERVFIAMHVPSGMSSYEGALFWQSQWQSQWDVLMNQYHQSIALIADGHTHMNALSRMRVSDDTITSLNVPGITPLHHNNPGMVDALWKIDVSGRTQWFDANVYAYSPSTKRWFLAENVRQAYSPSCQVVALTQCLGNVSHETFDAVLDRYFTLQADKIPTEGWDAVNQAAEYTVFANNP